MRMQNTHRFHIEQRCRVTGGDRGNGRAFWQSGRDMDRCRCRSRAGVRLSGRTAESWTDAEAEAEAGARQGHGLIGLHFVGLGWIALEWVGLGCN